MKKGKQRFFASLLATALVLACCFGFCVNSYAYYDFGTVEVSLGKTSVDLWSGQSETVSVSLSPASHDQLPGCGMAVCPQICGELGCFDENGQCTCNGRTYSTYYPSAEVSSSNTSVATVSYSGSAVTIRGVDAGEATITVTGSLRQWTPGTATIAVTVTNETGGFSASVDSSDQSASDYSDSSGSPGISVDTVAATQVSGTDNADAGRNAAEGQVAELGGGEETPAGDAGSAESAEGAESAESAEAVGSAGSAGSAKNTGEEAKESEGISKVDSDMGTFWFIPITGLPQGKEQFEEVMGDETQYLDFQLKDDTENVLYTWEFCGADVEQAEDMIFTIDSSRNAFEGCSYGTSNDSLYLSFVQEEDFVGKTSIFYRVSDCFSDDDVLYLYRYNPEDDTIELAAENLAVENGYVTMVLTEGGYDILTTEELLTGLEEAAEEEINQQPEEMDVDAMDEPEEAAEDNTGLSVGAIVAIVIVVAAAIAAVIIFLAIRAVRKKKKGPGDGTGEDESEFWVEAGEESDGDASESPEERDGDAPESPEESVEEGPEEETREE